MRGHPGSGLSSDLRFDLRFAVRSLRQQRGIPLAVVATLTLGRGATSALFSVVYAVLLRPLPVADPERVVMVYQQDRITGTLREPSSIPDYYDLAARARSFDALGAFTNGPMTIGGEGAEPGSVNATRVTHGPFRLLGTPPRLDRDFTVADDVPGGPKVVVLNDALWRSRFLADPGAVGRSVRLDDGPYTVVGIAPAGVELPGIATDLWVPLQHGPTSTPRTLHNVLVVGRLASGASAASAGREVGRIGAQLEADYPESNRGRGMVVEALTEVVVGGVRPALLLLLGGFAALAVVLACVGIHGVLSYAVTQRTRELGIRLALGAPRRRILGQIVGQALALTLVGVGIGLAGGLGFTRLLGSLLFGVGPTDPAVFGTTAISLAAVGIVASCLPARRASRVDPMVALRSE
jgi:hypothetical protein